MYLRGAMAADDEFTVENIVCINGGGLKYRVVIPPSHIKHVDGQPYIHLSTQQNYATALFGGGRCNVRGASGKPERALSRTDIVDKLADQRNKLIDEAMDAIMQKNKPHDTLAIFGEQKQPRVKAYQRVAIPETMTIDAPQIGDIQGVPMRVITKHKRGPLFVELVDRNLKYVRDACTAQIKAGGIKRYKTPMKRVRCVAKRKRTSTTKNTDHRSDTEITDMQSSAITPDLEGGPPIVETSSLSSSSQPVNMVTPTKVTSHRSGKLTDFFTRV